MSRQISSPNIASKGKLEKRVVTIPVALYRGSVPAGAQVVEEKKHSDNSASKGKKLIEEIDSSVKDANVKKELEKEKEAKPLKSAMKKSTAAAASPVAKTVVEKAPKPSPSLSTKDMYCPNWTWSTSSVTETTEQEGGVKKERVVERIVLDIDVPGLVEWIPVLAT